MDGEPKEREGGEDRKATISQGDGGSGKEDWGGRGDCTGAKRTPQKDRGPQSGVCRRRGLRQETSPLSSRPRETADAPAQFGVCTPPRAPAPARAGLQVIAHLEEGDVSIVANTPTLLCETDSPFSPPPIKLTNHPPFPGSERQKRSSCTQTDRELSSEGERGVFQETLEQLPVNTLEETPVTTSLSKLPGHIVCKELTSIGSWGGHELFQLNPTWNHLQPGQGSAVTATEHQL